MKLLNLLQEFMKEEPGDTLDITIAKLEALKAMLDLMLMMKPRNHSNGENFQRSIGKGS